MMKNSILPLCMVLASAVSALGCIGAEGTDDSTETETVGTTQEAALSNNALSNNALSNNALSNNALSNNALSNNSLSTNALSNNSLLTSALTDPNARELLKYVVSCALPATEKVEFTIDGVDYSFPGELGLTPKWGLVGGSCNTTCQEWVSACVMSRVDYLGATVSISLRGANAALTPTAAELATHTQREGAYYGNLFQDPPVRDGCIAPGATGLPRVCGPTLDGCVIHAVGYCTDVCTGSAGYGTFTNCADHGRVNGLFPAGTRSYPTAVTVFLDP